MSQDVFDRIVAEHPAHLDGIHQLARYLSGRSVGDAIRIGSITGFADLSSTLATSAMEHLAEAGIVQEEERWICTECDIIVEGDPEEDGSRECDVCARVFRTSSAETEVCYVLNVPITFSEIPVSNKQTSSSASNPLLDESARARANITPWKTLREQDYTISVTTLDGGTRTQALRLLSQYGIVRLRWQGDPPSQERLASLQNWIGPARQKQNDHDGVVKSLRPNYDAPPNTGDSAAALPPHVDGTQDERTPAVLAFQYDLSSTWGAESTFVDMAAMLSSLSLDGITRMLSALAVKDCATATKTKGSWSQTFVGPLVRAEHDGHAISIRFRSDNVLQVGTPYAPAFEELTRLVASWSSSNLIRVTPQEGDVVIFDNWRVLHGREAIGGRHQRIHDRMWIDDLAADHIGTYWLGVRPLSSTLMSLVQSANAGA